MYLSLENKQKLEVFVALFQLLKNWGSMLNLQFNTDELFIQTMDNSHVCLSNISIKGKWFSQYKIEMPTKISVDSSHFAIMINYALKHNKLEITFDESMDPDHLFINLLNSKEKKDNFDHFFELALVDIEQETLGVPEVEYDVDFLMDSKKFSELMSELMVFGTNLNIKCNEELLEFNANGDTGKLKVNIPIDDLNEYSIAEGEQFDLSYSLYHIGKMCLSTKLSSQVSLSISSEYPMIIKYDLGDDSICSFYIAPKIMD
jgi:proliferating cell nuclear antigen